MKRKIAKYISVAVFAMLLATIVTGLGCHAGEWTSPMPWWKMLSAIVSVLLLLGLFSGVLLAVRGIRNRLCLARSNTGLRKLGDLALVLFYGVLIPYSILWFIAEGVWIYHLGYTRDPILLSIVIFVSSVLAVQIVVEPDLGKPTADETPVEVSRVSKLITAALVIIIACTSFIPFLVKQGVRNWRIVTQPDSFFGLQSSDSVPLNASAEVSPKQESGVKTNASARPEAFSIAGGAFAGSIPFPQVPDSQYVDLESDIHQPLTPMKGARQVAFMLSCHAAIDNALRYWVGCDQNGNGKLELEETTFCFGWTGGEWSFETLGSDRLKFPSKTTGQRKNLELCIEINAQGCCTGLKLIEDGELLAGSEDFAKCLPEDPDTWNIVRIIRNGPTPTNESSSIRIRSR